MENISVIWKPTQRVEAHTQCSSLKALETISFVSRQGEKEDGLEKIASLISRENFRVRVRNKGNPKVNHCNIYFFLQGFIIALQILVYYLD